MGAPQLAQKITLIALLDVNTYTLVRLKAIPLTAPLASGFEAFQQDWMGVHHEDLFLHIDLVGAKTTVVARDADLDFLIDDLSRAVLTVTKGDRDAALYVQYFGAQRPSEIKKPTLGKELETCRAWIPSLKASPHASLVELGHQIADKVAAADAAVAQKAAVEQKAHDFRKIGALKALIDKANALRQETFGKLAAMPHAMSQAHLPTAFADSFFMHTERSEEAAATIEDLKEQIKALKEQIADLETELKKLEEQEKAGANAARTRRAVEIQKELEDENNKRQAAEARIAALQDELKPKP